MLGDTIAVNHAPPWLLFGSFSSPYSSGTSTGSPRVLTLTMSGVTIPHVQNHLVHDTFAGGSPETGFYKDSSGDIVAVHGAPMFTLDPLHNCAGITAVAALRALGVRSIGISVSLEKGLPLGSDLGSSAASAAVVAFAVNALFDDRLSGLVLANPFTRT